VHFLDPFKKNQMLFFEYFKIGCMYWIILLLSERYEVGVKNCSIFGENMAYSPHNHEKIF
jgi:hypothetical protein